MDSGMIRLVCAAIAVVFGIFIVMRRKSRKVE
jgi:hypothetical protein